MRTEVSFVYLYSKSVAVDMKKAMKAVTCVKQATTGVNQADTGVKQAGQDLAKATAEHMVDKGHMYNMKNMLPGPHLHPGHNELKRI